MQTKSLGLLIGLIVLTMPAVATATAPQPAKTLAYTTGKGLVAVRDNARPIVIDPSGATPIVSPRGNLIAYSKDAGGSRGAKLMVARSDGSLRRTLVSGIVSPRSGGVAWSPDEELVAAVISRSGRQQLVLADVFTGARHTIATGWFGGVSFSPDGARIAFGRARNRNDAGDLYVVPVVGSGAQKITGDNHSMYPLWGTSAILFSRVTEKTDDEAAVNIARIQPDGSDPGIVTHFRSASHRLVPVALSESGTRLLVNRYSPAAGYSRTETIDLVSGVVHSLLSKRDSTPQGISTDGNTVLVGTDAGLMTLPFTGGKAKVLVRGWPDGSWAGY